MRRSDHRCLDIMCDDDDRSLLQVAMDVVMTKRGSYERPQEHQVMDLQTLACSMIEWEPPKKGHEAFDEAVKNLIRAALDEKDSCGT